MKTGLNIWIYFLILAGLSACDTKQDWFDSGISSPYHDCSIMEYLQKDTANWKLTVELIERAELTHIFEGKDPNYKEITFFAPPSLSILRYVWDKASGKEQFPGDPDRWRALSEDEKNHPEHLVQALDKDWCREMVLRHVIKLRAYREKTNYGGVTDAGAIFMYLYSFDAMEMVPLASPDIQPLNGVVHALNYNYVLGKI